MFHAARHQTINYRPSIQTTAQATFNPCILCPFASVCDVSLTYSLLLELQTKLVQVNYKARYLRQRRFRLKFILQHTHTHIRRTALAVPLMWWSLTTMLGGTMLNGCPTPRDKLTNSARPQNARTGRRKLQTVERAWWVGGSYRQLMQCISAMHLPSARHRVQSRNVHIINLYRARPILRYARVHRRSTRKPVGPCVQ